MQIMQKFSTRKIPFNLTSAMLIQSKETLQSIFCNPPFYRNISHQNTYNLFSLISFKLKIPVI